MTMELVKCEIKTGEQITAPGTQAGGIFVARIVSVSEKSIKVDFCWDSSMNRGVTVFTYTTWIPKSQVIHDEHGFLTVKRWWINHINKDFVHRIKKYYLSNGQQVFVNH